MKQIFIKGGSARIAEVPIPQITSNEVLVQLKSSCISIGTELTSIKGTSIPLWRRAINQPSKVVKLLKMGSELGFHRAASLVDSQKVAEYPTGYSASGVVVETGSNVTDLSIGDTVACAGALYAYHAEFIRVPRNLCVPIPTNVDVISSSTVTLGAIALQGVRRASPTIGETFVVLGLGALGQLTCQILSANGCNVIGIDLDKSRVELALSLGIKHGFCSSEISPKDISKLTDGYGADGVIVTAATSSDTLISNAFKMCRRKGRVVLVGDVGLNLNRSDFYFNEIDFLISTSYGPGRYDYQYEENGLDYPIGYVRWTENRNMQEYIRLIADKKINIAPLNPSIYTLSEAPKAFEAIDNKEKPLLVILEYPETFSSIISKPTSITSLSNKENTDVINIGLIGVGGFACSTHLPNIKKLSSKFHLRALCNKSSRYILSASNQFKPDYITSNFKDILEDPAINAVLICTRHNSHSELVVSALKADKHVLVEKPLALTHEGMQNIKDFFDSWDFASGKNPPMLLTGFNRRFSKIAKKLSHIISENTSSFILNYRMNVPYVPNDSWLHGPEGGGRNIGEACHIYDLFTFLAQSEVSEVSAHSIRPTSHYYRRTDNFVATITFANGSVCNLIYTSQGNDGVAKESAELFVNGNVVYFTDYKSMRIYGNNPSSCDSAIQDKGLLTELEEFYNGINTGIWPIPLWQQTQTTELSFLIESLITS